MDLKEAYDTLGIKNSATKEEAKKAFKKLAAKHHPDKTDGNADLFKKINEAYQLIDTGKDFGPTNYASSNSSYGGGYSVDIEDLIRQATGNNFGQNGNFAQSRKKQYRVEDKFMQVQISFKEAVIGCQKTLEYKRKLKCDKCSGEGFSRVDNGCKNCGGSGVTVVQRGNVVMQSTCSGCHGKVKVESCSNCKEHGFIEKDISLTANIPGGIKDGRNVLRLQGVGDYAGSFFGGDQYSSVILTVNFEKHDSLFIEDADVITTCKISLLEALQGCKKSIPTIDGDKEVDVPPLTKHQEQIILPNLGVNKIGNERIIMDVHYPNNLDKLITALQTTEEN